MKQKNKRGDIPITILVLGVVLICIVAIFTFYHSSQAVKNSLNSVGILQKAAEIGDKITLYQNLGFSKDQIDKTFFVHQDSGGRYVNFSASGLSVKYYLPPRP